MTSEQIFTPGQTEVIEIVKDYFASTMKMVCAQPVLYELNIEENEWHSDSLMFRIPFLGREFSVPWKSNGVSTVLWFEATNATFPTDLFLRCEFDVYDNDLVELPVLAALCGEDDDGNVVSIGFDVG